MSDPGTASQSRIRQVEAIANGTVIDHLPASATLKVAGIVTRPEDQVFIGVNLRSNRVGRKGVVKVANREIDARALAGLALAAPEATVCIIRDFTVISKRRVEVPDRFTGVARCANPNCITNHEKVATEFVVVATSPLVVRCTYCERRFPAAELTIL